LGHERGVLVLDPVALALFFIVQQRMRPGAILGPSAELSYLAMTADQARILRQLAHERRAEIIQRWSIGIYDGLDEALWNIESAGAAYVRPQAPSYRVIGR
jgi:hypothetical protein